MCICKDGGEGYVGTKEFPLNLDCHLYLNSHCLITPEQLSMNW